MTTIHFSLDNLPPLVAFMEACRLLSVGKTTLYTAIERDEILSVKLGKRRLIPASEIRRLAEGRAA